MRYLYLVRHGEAIADGELSPTGREQAALLGRRLGAVPLTALHHSPELRAAQTAQVIAEHRPAGPAPVPVLELGDHPPAAHDPATLPAPYAAFYSGFTADELAAGPPRARAALLRYAQPAESECHELVITHNFLIGWFVRHALEAPPARWLGLNQANGGLTVILYRPDRPPALACFNDLSHLPPRLRWTGFPPELHLP